MTRYSQVQQLDRTPLDAEHTTLTVNNLLFFRFLGFIFFFFFKLDKSTVSLVIRIEEINFDLSTIAYINSISISLDIILPPASPFATKSYIPIDVEFNYFAIAKPTTTTSDWYYNY